MQHITLRLPREAKAFIEQEAEKYGSSLNSEIIRSIRERMERVQRNQVMPASARE